MSTDKTLVKRRKTTTDAQVFNELVNRAIRSTVPDNQGRPASARAAEKHAQPEINFWDVGASVPSRRRREGESSQGQKTKYCETARGTVQEQIDQAFLGMTPDDIALMQHKLAAAAFFCSRSAATRWIVSTVRSTLVDQRGSRGGIWAKKHPLLPTVETELLDGTSLRDALRLVRNWADTLDLSLEQPLQNDDDYPELLMDFEIIRTVLPRLSVAWDLTQSKAAQDPTYVEYLITDDSCKNSDGNAREFGAAVRVSSVGNRAVNFSKKKNELLMLLYDQQQSLRRELKQCANATDEKLRALILPGLLIDGSTYHCFAVGHLSDDVFGGFEISPGACIPTNFADRSPSQLAALYELQQPFKALVEKAVQTFDEIRERVASATQL
ncbi:hypothetical protein DFS34DRAFT_646339 [Phlyctochytrium arcticum]|nr:hypothetical protein DFS34DRAFT_646339 [Phlyctochytrium arcticum]